MPLQIVITRENTLCKTILFQLSTKLDWIVLFFFSFLRIDEMEVMHFNFRTKKIEENFLMLKKVQSGKRVGAFWHIVFKNIDFYKRIDLKAWQMFTPTPNTVLKNPNVRAKIWWAATLVEGRMKCLMWPRGLGNAWFSFSNFF